tara:strand:+ start:153 stop:890 length:738 start_codon:yes stop_codon:yes gene_type:complete
MAQEISDFIANGFSLKSHLQQYLQINEDELEGRLFKGKDELAALHPGAFKSEEATSFYEKQVGEFHLLELAAWHLGSAQYIAETLLVQKMFAHGQVLDFGGGIGTHAIAAASLPNVDHVWFVDLNPDHRKFVEYRAKIFGLDDVISVHRDLKSVKDIEFDTVVCLDVLEHIPNPSEQLIEFFRKMSKDSIALFNWYFFKGFNKEYPFHFDDPSMIEEFFKTLQTNFIEVFHPYLITTRSYKPIKN